MNKSMFLFYLNEFSAIALLEKSEHMKFSQTKLVFKHMAYDFASRGQKWGNRFASSHQKSYKYFFFGLVQEQRQPNDGIQK